MSENTVTVADIQIQLVEAAFTESETVTAYTVSVLVNGVFKATGTDKGIPSQMMYNYTRNGLIARRTKGMSAKDVRYTKDEVLGFVTRYTNKYIGQ